MNADDVTRVAAAAENLHIEPRGQRWTHLSLCVLNAVFSIGAHYSVTVRTCRSYAQHAGLQRLLAPAEDVATGGTAGEEQPLSVFLGDFEAHGAEAYATGILDNQQRTSTRGGILKAEAAGRYAKVLVAHNVERIGDVDGLLDDPGRLTAVERELAGVPGHGGHGIRRDYLWMLAGSDHLVKPDRMVRRWLGAVLNEPVDASRARHLVQEAAAQIGRSPWELDHAIWRAARRRS